MLDEQSQTAAKRMQLQIDFGLCKVPKNEYQVSMLKYFVRDAFDTMSMGNYPFESNYIAGTEDKPMPTYPVSVACNYLKDASRALNSTMLFSATCIRQAVTKHDLSAIMIRRGGHHLDLMFSHPNDPQEVVEARKFEMNAVKRWIEEFQGRTKAMSWGDL